MEDKIKLLIETVGCNQYEAELALKSAKGNFADALDFLNRVSPGLGILKGKFYIQNKFIYGMFLIISDIKHNTTLSVSSIVSANPAVFASDMDKSWEEIEKTVFIYRMDNGVHPEYSNKLQEKLYQISIAMNLTVDSKKAEEKIRELLSESFSLENTDTGNVNILIDYSEEAYKTQSSENPYIDIPSVTVGEKITLALELLDDKSGCPAGSLSVGDVVWIKITDHRDIAEYLSHRLGGRDGSKIQPLATQIMAIRKSVGSIVVKFRFTEKIEGTAETSPEFKVKVVSRSVSGGLINWLRTIAK